VRRFAFMEFGLPGFGYEQGMMPSPDWTNGSNWHLSFFTLPDIAERFLAGQERELLAWFFWHLSCNPEAVSGEDFEAYVREISKPGALRAGIQYYAAVWVDAEDNKASARTPMAMPVLGVGGECSAGPFMAQILEPVATEVRPVVIPAPATGSATRTRPRLPMRSSPSSVRRGRPSGRDDPDHRVSRGTIT
jgi:hypothetical protein